MKNLFIILSLLLCISCKQSNQESNDSSTVLTGTISNATLEYFNVQADYGVRNKISINNGEFKMEDKFEWPKLFSLNMGRNQIKCYLSPGDNLHVEFDEEDIPGTIKFTGSHALENTILNAYSEYRNEIEPDRNSLFIKDEAEFISFIDSMKNETEKYLAKQFQENNSLDKKFEELLRADYYYAMAIHLDRYKNFHIRIAEDTSYVESDELIGLKKKIKLESKDALGSIEYTNYLIRQVNRMIREYKKEEYKDELELFLANDLVNTFESATTKEFVKFSILNSSIPRGRMDDLMYLITDFQENTSNPVLADKLTQQLDAYAHLKKGASAPDFSYPDIENLSHSLSDYKGKIVYIDVWATWCKPCLAEQPALAELEEHYSDNEEIVFMGVSVDKDQEAWKKMVQEKDLQGVQLIKDFDAETDISDLYKISGIPRFILVDIDGSLADAYAPRPSSGEMQSFLEDLLEENMQETTSETSTL